MLRKTLITSAITLSLLAPMIASADVVTDTSGIEINKPINVQKSYDLVVSDLSSDDYSATVSKYDDSRNDKEMAKTQVDVGNLHITGGGSDPYLFEISLTQSGIDKVKAETGATDMEITEAKIIAKIGGTSSSDPDMYGSMKALTTDTMPDVGHPIVIVNRSVGSKTVSDSQALREVMVDAAASKDKQQNKHEISSDANKILKDSGTQLIAGANVSPTNINQKVRNESQGVSKKTFEKQQAAEKRKQLMKQIVNVSWRLAGILIIVLGAGLLAWMVWFFRKRKEM